MTGDVGSNGSGYGKPPADGRFHKGKSGNPRGRPKGSKNLATHFMEAISQTVPVKQDGRSVRMTKLQATIMQLVNKGAQGDTRAMVEVLDRVAELEARAEERAGAATMFNEADRAVIMEVYRRLTEAQ